VRCRRGLKRNFGWQDTWWSDDFVCLDLFEKGEGGGEVGWSEKLGGVAGFKKKTRRIDYLVDLWTAGGTGVDTVVSVDWSALERRRRVYIG
jgi:hypothetical protein